MKEPIHPIQKITGFTIVAPFTLELHFHDGEKRTIDFRPVLCGEMYGPLADKAFFEKVYLDREVHTISWPNGADFDPYLLYNWDIYRNELVARAKQWAAA
jgi:hypothetical protein